MTFISYSQNNEDVLLWRALGHVTDGFYIDVGASDPVEHSVTKAFYDAGWHGINVEPLPAHIAAFDAQRPRDINLAVAAGSAEGSLTLYDVPAVRGWASPEASVAELHRAEGHAVTEVTVPVRPLAAICAEQVQGDIHFLKIDVEGFEEAVLRGMDFARWRPWVLVIEATLPNSRVTNHDAWEHLVTAQRYRFVWFDGLNRYYVADEHADLRRHFGIQPNVFDDFISYHLDQAWDATRRTDSALQASDRALQASQRELVGTRADLDDALRHVDALARDNAAAHAETVRVQAELDAAHTDIAQLRHDLAQSEASGHQLTQWAQDLEQRLLATLNSTSWKITKPLRNAVTLTRRLRQPGLAGRALHRITANEKLRRTLIPILLRYPALGRRVSTIVQTVKLAAPEQAPDAVAVPEELRHLPASARAVLADLRRVRARVPEQHQQKTGS